MNNTQSPAPETIRKIRNTYKHTQHDAAKIIGCHVDEWMEWEEGIKVMHDALWILYLKRIGII